MVIFTLLLSKCGTSGNGTSENNKVKQQKIDEKKKIKEQSEELRKNSDEGVGEDELEPEEEIELERLKDQERLLKEVSEKASQELDQMNQSLKAFNIRMKGFNKDSQQVIDEMDINLLDLYKKPGILIAGSYEVSYIILNLDEEFTIEKLDGADRLFNNVKVERNSSDNNYKIILTGKSSERTDLKDLPKNLIIKINGTEIPFTLFKFTSKTLKDSSLQDKYIIKN